MNVRGCVPDGWWTDKAAALRRLVTAVAEHDFDGEWVLVIADGHPIEGVPAGTRGDVELRYANRSTPDAADDLIVETVLAEESATETITVVTSDRGLLDRLPPHVRIEGSRSFRNRVGW